MIKIIADTHTHTLASDHAFSTLTENVAAAKAKGLLAIAMTEHSPSLPGGPSWLHFDNPYAFPDVMDGVAIIRGIEVNIMDYDGTLDLRYSLLRKLEWIIASLHATNIEPAGIEDHTRVWLAVAENPLVDVIGHCTDGRYPFDHERVLKAFKKYDKIVEINTHALNIRLRAKEICADVAKLCAKLEIPVVVSSDAHYSTMIGEFTGALELLESVDFPEKLILNADKERFFSAVKARKAYRPK